MEFDADASPTPTLLMTVVTHDVQRGDGLQERVELLFAFFYQDFGACGVILQC